MEKSAKICLPLPLDELYYRVPEPLLGRVNVGDKVLVPLLKKEIIGIVTALCSEEKEDAKQIIDVLEQGFLTPSFIELSKTLSKRTVLPIGTVMKMMLPSIWQTSLFVKYNPSSKEMIKKNAFLQQKLLEEIKRRPLSLRTLRKIFGNSIYKALLSLKKKGLVHLYTPLPKNKAQKKEKKASLPSLSKKEEKIIKRIKEYVKVGKHCLLILPNPINIYMHLCFDALKEGKNAIIIFPTKERLKKIGECLINVFGEDVLLCEKGAFPKIIEPKIIIGTYPALFLPLKNPYILIMDQEAHPSYKKVPPFLLHVRHIALMRAKIEKMPLILSSIVPSVESYYLASKGVYEYVNVFEERKKALVIQIKKEELLSEPLVKKMKKALKNKENVLIFFNRKGFSRYICCNECKSVLLCKECKMPLIFYKQKHILLCHYCKKSEAVPSVCHHCKSIALECGGAGIEKVEEEMRKLFPSKKILLLQKGCFKEKIPLQAQILLATSSLVYKSALQNIGLFAILSADLDFNSPDFGCCEDAFYYYNYLLHLCRPKEFIIQTFSPFNHVVRSLQKDIKLFYKKELFFRKRLNYPPFSISFTLYVNDASSTKEALRCIKGHLLGPKKREDSYVFFLSTKKEELSKILPILLHLRKKGILLKIEESV